MTVEITLPDQLALDAQRAGLLEPELLENWLKEQLRAQSAHSLLEAMDRMAAVEGLPYMSPEEISEEIHAMRAERRRDSRS